MLKNTPYFSCHYFYFVFLGTWCKNYKNIYESIEQREHKETNNETLDNNEQEENTKYHN